MSAGAKPRFLAFEPWLWGLGIFLLTTPFAFQIAGIDPTQAIVRDASFKRVNGSAWIFYAIRMAIAAMAFVAIMPIWRQAYDRVRCIVPTLLFVVWAAISLFWCVALSPSLNGVLALIPLVIVGFAMACRLPPDGFARSIVYACAAMIFFSYVYVFAVPIYGVHQANEASQAVHAGSWRGVYGHKNLFGGMCATAATAVILAGRSVLPSLILKIILLAAIAVAIIMSRSATAVALTMIGPVVALLFVSLGRLRLLLLVLVVVPATLIFYANRDAILALLGRDATLTGRTGIWSFVPDAISQYPFTGYGYASTTYGEFTVHIMDAFGLSDPHNGYLNLLLSVGFVGLALFLVMIYSAWRVARRLYRSEGTRGAALVCFGVIVAWLIGMMTESHDRPLQPMAALGFVALGMLVFGQEDSDGDVADMMLEEADRPQVSGRAVFS